MTYKFKLSIIAIFIIQLAGAQTNPAITEFLINTSGITGRHYVQGNSTPIDDTYSANVQKVQYSDDYSYINSSGIPGYIVGPYLDGNPALASDNEWLFKIPLSPMENTGTETSTPLGAIGVFINGVPMYDYKDAASYSSTSMQDDMQNGDGVWNRNAIKAENEGFDCAKGHPSPIFSGGPGGTLDGGTYHHHQNPTAFNLDKIELSNVCDLYLADGLYNLDDSKHSPLIGFAFDGFPIYGSYGYSDPLDVSSSIQLIKSSYQKRSITHRTHYADGTDVTDGPDVSSTFPIGWYKEDYEYIASSGDLDEHNGRFCKTPEYPDGTYAYFATVDDDWNSTYPYIIGSTYYGIVETDNFVSMGGGNSVSINEQVTEYNTSNSISTNTIKSLDINAYYSASSELIAIQVNGLLKSDINVQLYDMSGRLVSSTLINQGSTIWHLDAKTLYNGQYVLSMTDGSQILSKKVIISR